MKKANIFLCCAFFVAVHAPAIFAAAYQSGDATANQYTALVESLTAEINAIRDESALIDPKTEPEKVAALTQRIQNLYIPLDDLNTFVDQAIENDPDFKSKLNNEGMPPRIIEQALELALRHDLEAVGKTLGFNETAENPVQSLGDYEWSIFGKVEDRKGPLMQFERLDERYKMYAPFFAEAREGRFGAVDSNGNYIYPYGKRYTPQEAHVIIHIATFVQSVEAAFKLAKYDGGRHLSNLLKTYIEWAHDPGTHVHYDIDIVMSHGSLRGIADKNNKTMVDWADKLFEEFQNDYLDLPYRAEVLKQFQILTRTLHRGLYKHPETLKRERKGLPVGKKLERVRVLDPFNAEYADFEGAFKPEKEGPASTATGLDLATQRDLKDVRYYAKYSFPKKSSMESQPSYEIDETAVSSSETNN